MKQPVLDAEVEEGEELKPKFISMLWCRNIR
jgi:hypothetical protein